jgi:hypothetical protein
MADAVLLIALGGLATDASGQTEQNFDVSGSGMPYSTGNHILPPLPPAPGSALLAGGPTAAGRFIRLAFQAPVPVHNSIAFDRSRPGAFETVVVDFDFRMTHAVGSRADGIGFAFLPTAVYNTIGSVPPEGPWFAAEEPNFRGALGIGFDIHKKDPEPADPGDVSNNHLSVHFDGIEKQEFDVSESIDLASGRWIHARIILSPGHQHDVTVILTPEGGRPVTVIDRVAVDGFNPYEGRAYFAARSGGESANHDLDNISVQFLTASDSLLSLSAVGVSAVESQGAVAITVNRIGNTAGPASVTYATGDVTATSPSDYQAISGTVSFAANQAAATFTVVINNDSVAELLSGEQFTVSLADAVGGALGGPSTGVVTIVDDEAARVSGHWEARQDWPVVPIHMTLMPTGKVIFWEGAGENDHTALFREIRSWDPASGAIQTVALPGYDIFCSGHSLLPDGRLFVTGGHNQMNSFGWEHASAYDAATDTWRRVPDMNKGRWYPTNTALGNGDVLVVSGDVTPTERNTVPQIWQVATSTWRDLTGAAGTGLSSELYPRMFLGPDGRIFKAGPDAATGFLDTSGNGRWTAGPFRSLANRDYGSAVLYDGKVLMIGGGGGVAEPTVDPSKSSEVIDLSEPFPAWRTLQNDMQFARRHHNATLLPTGQVLVTGGTSSPGFNDAAAGVLEAELFDPGTGVWTTLAPMTTKRVYHSTALLLPDGRVVTGGGGQPPPGGDENQKNVEVFSPPYLFKGARPLISGAPSRLIHGESPLIQTPTPAAISKVTLIRLPSVTHAFDQNQRLLTLHFAVTAGGLTIDVPGPNLAPPGHYMLFLVNTVGVPSVASIVNVGPACGYAVSPAFDVFGSAATSSAVSVAASVGCTWTATSQSPFITVTSSAAAAGNDTVTFTLAPNTSDTGRTGMLLVAGQTVFVRQAGVGAPLRVPDVDGDGFADLTAFRPATGQWFVRRSMSHYGYGDFLTLQWGIPGDRPLAADFDGDRRMDLTIYRPATGQWFIRYSSRSYSYEFDTYQWGLATDVPLEADFDGDRRSDLVVYRPATGEWFVRYSSRNYSYAFDVFQWGLPGDRPLAADFDADGRTDLAVYRPSSGQWFIRYSSRAYSYAFDVYQWGLSTDVPLSADFDGDRRSDLAVYRPSNGTWYVRFSSSGYSYADWAAYQWGVPGDLPLAGDFDGDERNDLIVYRPATGEWFVRYSSAGYSYSATATYQWGVPQDLPLIPRKP